LWKIQLKKANGKSNNQRLNSLTRVRGRRKEGKLLPRGGLNG